MAKPKKNGRSRKKGNRGEIKAQRQKPIKDRSAMTIEQLKKETISLDIKKSPQYINKVERIFEYVKEGAKAKEIFAIFLAENNNLTYEKFTEMVDDAHKLAEASIHLDREYTFQLHMNRYEKLYEEAMKMETHDGIPFNNRKHWNAKCMQYIAALNALQAKEKLLGLHDKSMVIEINNNKAFVVEKEEKRGLLPGYDLDKLTLEEQKELLTIIQEARTVPIEGIQRVTVKQTVIEINTQTGERNQYTKQTNIDNVEKVNIEDIEFEEMPNNVVKDFEKLPDKSEEEEIDLGSMRIEDLTEGKLENRKGKEVVNEVNNNLLEELRKRKLQKKK